MSKILGLVVCVALFQMLTQVGLYTSVNFSRNPGYAHTIVNFNVILVFLVSLWAFRSKFHWISGLGVLVGVGGVALVTYGETRTGPSTAGPGVV